VQQGPGARELARSLGDAPHRVPKTHGVLVTCLTRVAQPPFTQGLRFAEKAHDPPGRLIAPRPPVAVALAGKEVPAADGAHRHRPEILGSVPDVAEGLNGLPQRERGVCAGRYPL
jgi:hypothetical protein